MKRTAAFLCLLLAITMSFGKWLILIEFDMNRQFIAEQLCVNRAQRDSGCKGRCQLRKALRAEEPPSQAPVASLKLKFPELLVSWPSAIHPHPASFGKRLPYPDLTILTYSSPLREIFHPPAWHNS